MVTSQSLQSCLLTRSIFLNSYANILLFLLTLVWTIQRIGEFRHFVLTVSFAQRTISNVLHKSYLLIIEVSNSKHILTYSRDLWRWIHSNQSSFILPYSSYLFSHIIQFYFHHGTCNSLKVPWLFLPTSPNI